jgi:hypothetical protein
MNVKEYTSHVAYLFALFKEAHTQMMLTRQGIQEDESLKLWLTLTTCTNEEQQQMVVENRRKRLQRQGFEPYYDEDMHDWTLKPLP